ncbi:hypothetical protein A0H76_18 [Hepatospora eriocheir]|uniref:Uncharacterized protein n=1 Tax=Hepatospora eriocheir TaxID=1081669 RepID=A0A1X0QLM5_9MICR|nr:hypothetical protein A0H76_18 [Hepatospora eriocheir]
MIRSVLFSLVLILSSTQNLLDPFQCDSDSSMATLRNDKVEGTERTQKRRFIFPFFSYIRRFFNRRKKYNVDNKICSDDKQVLVYKLNNKNTDSERGYLNGCFIDYDSFEDSSLTDEEENIETSISSDDSDDESTNKQNIKN